MDLPAESQLPLFAGVANIALAGTFIVLWRLRPSAPLRMFTLSFVSIGVALLLVAARIALDGLTGYGPIITAVLIAATAFLLAGCLLHTGRAASGRWIAAGAVLLWASVQVSKYGFGIQSSHYLIVCISAAFLFGGYLFWSNAGVTGRRTLAVLFWLRALVTLPWPLLRDTPAVALIYGLDQMLVIFIGVALIVSELIRARRQTEAANAELQRQAEDLAALNGQLEIERQLAVSASNAKSTFLANMSHELRTPLNAVIGFADVIATQRLGDCPARYAAYGKDIEGAAKQLLGLIDQLLELSRIETEGIELAPGPVDLRRLIDEAAALATRQAGADGVEISVEIAPGAEAIEGDQRFLAQVVFGLLRRGVNAAAPAGRVCVRARPTAGGRVSILVTDDGSDLSPSELAAAFQPFSLNGATVAQPQGIDLTLPVAKRLVEAHGGEIDIAPGRRGGTQVSVALPRRAAE